LLHFIYNYYKIKNNPSILSQFSLVYRIHHFNH
jgi:hypothetical protein